MTDNRFANRMLVLIGINVIVTIAASFAADYTSLGLVHAAISGLQMALFAITMGVTMSYVLKDY